MNVFVPHKKDFNTYFDEIISYASINYIFSSLENYSTTYEIVNIQFPEAIFNWEQPTKEQLIDFENRIIYWKKKSKIVLTLNDVESHYDSENKFKSLFILIRKYVDGVIHLGEYSLNNYAHLFSKNCKHKVIYHPLYIGLKNECVEKDFQKAFNVNFTNKLVVTVVGNVRSLEELKLIIKIFKKIKARNKILVVPKMYNYFKIPKHFPYRYRNLYKTIKSLLLLYPLKRNQYYFGYKFVETGLLVNLINKSSLIIIPRKRNLNSGILYLGFTFDKPMVIPRIGNLTETAAYFNFPLLDFEKNNYKNVLDKVTSTDFKKIFLTKDYLKKKNEFHPTKISKEYELFFKSLIKL
ncbi:hypothetical protein R3X25_09135 [Lutibacter sp. TH_r2]|uniref:hypothetical protein n=1 Tax=Lutibacter sp. TH_r2 TaxID=3082083 RepID=UPI002953C458|nr:hypothetical protein [Lutibacter sp. TH_r2]MDV7187443.1 hypothetical protein [Lutibacter sp. TH_r2]